MDWKNASVDKCIEQIDFLVFRDEHRHPLRNSEAFIRLVELAQMADIKVATTFATLDEYQKMSAGRTSPTHGTTFIGRYTGRDVDIRQYLESKQVGCICLEPQKKIDNVINVTPEMAKEEGVRLARIKELRAELAKLEK